jgi:quercetin dioxygenase-like cupin family protein
MGTIHKQASDAGSSNWRYPSVPLSDYSTAASAGVTKQVLMGANEGAVDFLVRYFTIPPGGNSALDHHEHQHGVVVTHGQGRVLLGEHWHDITVGDAICTDINEIHQFVATGNAPLGFICVIPQWAESDSCAGPRK